MALCQTGRHHGAHSKQGTGEYIVKKLSVRRSGYILLAIVALSAGVIFENQRPPEVTVAYRRRLGRAAAWWIA